ncbi:MAG: hypothetical protein ABJE10_14985 [bacterium]
MSEGYLRSIAGKNPEVVERLVNDLRATPRETVRESGAKALKDYDPKPALAAYHGPKLAIVIPQNDSPISLHRIGAGMPHEVISGTGHWVALEKPAEVNRLLDRFLSTID